MSVYTNFKFPKSSADVLDRVVEAYGFSMKMELAYHLGIAASSLSARYKRDVFPSDIVLQCVMETGVNLHWIVTGKGKKFENDKLDIPSIVRKELIGGEVNDDGYVILDSALFPPPKTEPRNGFLLFDATSQHQYVINPDFDDVYDGQWLVEIEDKTSIRTITRIPVKKVRVSGGDITFDCGLDDIKLIGHVVLTIK
ncbi:phage repressor protein CI [Dickeya solani]|uniref:Phage repressor protein CI n=1 Tax=Dickeya solani TaxID=1089444 RepID=A0ABU4EFJ4_9GAMM|nr:phage repressor protein CI [Dickeya solani]MCA7001312.1 helix-turn-helix domain-containing protein [Dickeya solani]MCZ0821045.1 phage repressor protein CI [Dickeya solani]MDV6996687.1 phage repressor protein CI [Dickeya solani]MDV7002841.1 phage repressor protein CI [Dickeya solani]MDV7038509.1 phage repressor protein CI [Dickeya solani]